MDNLYCARILEMQNLIKTLYYFFKSGQDCKTADENLGCSGYTNQGKVDPVNLKHMKGSGNKNFPNSVKDVGVYNNKIHFFPSAISICCLSEIKDQFIIKFGNKVKH